MSAEWPGSDNVRFIIVSAHSESPVGEARLAVVTLPEYISSCSENKKPFPFFLSLLLSHTFSLSHTFFFFFACVITAIFRSWAPPSLYWRCLIVGLVYSLEKIVHAAMKADDDGKLSKDQRAARQKENKKLQIYKKKKCWPTSALAYQDAESLSCKSRLILFFVAVAASQIGRESYSPSK